MSGNTKVSPNNLAMLYGDTYYYLSHNSQGFSVYADGQLNPLYELEEPILLVQGTAVNSQHVHLTFLKSNGELCYSLVSESGTNQTTTLAKLDVHSTRYRRLMLIPMGKTVHIFYSNSHRAIPEVWHIEHLFWNGHTWRSTHLGEVVHPSEPLYSVSIDFKKNLHFLMLTYQGSKSIVFTNLFHGTFHIWGGPKEALNIPQEVSDIATIMTSSNTHHLFWIGKTILGQLELGWAHRSEAHDLSSVWIKAPAPIQTFKGPARGIGVLEVNGCLWLLNNAEQETLLISKGNGWVRTASHPSNSKPLNISHYTQQGYHFTFWLANHQNPRIPAYQDEIGLNITKPEQNLTAISQTIPKPEYQYTSVPDYVPLPEYVPLTEQTSTNTPTSHSIENKEKQPFEENPSFKKISPDPDTNLDLPNQSTKTLDDIVQTNIIDSVKPFISETLEPILSAICDNEEKNAQLFGTIQNLTLDSDKIQRSLTEIRQRIEKMETEIEEIKSENTKGFWKRWFK